MKLNELRDKIHENAKAKGFYDDEMKSNQWNLNCKNILKHAFFAQKIALIHSELSEALEADRKGMHADLSEYDRLKQGLKDTGINYYTDSAFFNTVKNTIEDELADVIIRTLDLCGYMGIDIEKHVELKMKYNKTREYKHGKNY
jgi:NTP pyrophosphatase (non-canonical NTP hydrolase)